MTKTIDDLTVHWQEDDKVVVKELAKCVLNEHAGWASIAYVFQDWDAKNEEYYKPKLAIRRYRKRGGKWLVFSKIVMTSKEQVVQLKEALNNWQEFF